MPVHTINDLPVEMLLHIFSYVNFDSLITLKNVCKYWNHLIANHDIVSVVPLFYESKSNFSDILHKLEGNWKFVGSVVIRANNSYNYISIVLDNCKKLKNLQMVMCGMDNMMISHINNLSNLTVLDIKNCYKYKSFSNQGELDMCINFFQFLNLRYLCLSNFGLTNETFRGLLQCDKLSHLDIKKIESLSQENVASFILQNKNILTTLCLHGGETFNDKISHYIIDCLNMKRLHIIRCQNFTDKSLELISRIGLVDLLLWNNDKFSEQGLIRLFSNDSFVSNLKYLSFSKVKNVTKELIHNLSENCERLEFIGLYKCPKIQLKEKSLIEMFPNAKVFICH